ncbi:MAG: hypothetical protein NTW78_06140 [Campylobacterales bacterium]|nr:hypothetical protein [Campylobacterales bacterium]
MEKIELFIPTIYSHSLFKDEKNKNILIKKREIDYYYSLIYIYRLKILENNPNLLIKVKDEDNKTTHHWNDEITDWNSEIISIDMYEVLSTIKTKHNSNFEDLKEFVDTLKSLKIKTNILNKDTTHPSMIIKIVDTVDWNEFKINIKFNDVFIKDFIHTNLFYKKIILNHFFNLSGYKNKVLYLLLKDYVGVSKKITSKEITTMIGTVSSSLFEGLIQSINDTTDVKVTTIKPKREEKRSKTTIHNFTIKNQKKFLNRKDEIEFNTKNDLWKKSEEEMKKQITKGGNIKNKEEYTKTIYKSLMLNFENIVEIEEVIDEVRKSLIDKKRKNEYQYLVMVSEVDKKQYMINDEYLLYEYPFPKPITSKIIDTYKFFDENNIGWKFITNDKPLLNFTKSLL